ncbi:MAG: hypothetical protein ACOX8V_07790 [Thermoleophilia bacterium]|jgi:hypothetical protein
MRILFLISVLGLGGAEKQLVAWAELLQTELGARICCFFRLDPNRPYQSTGGSRCPSSSWGETANLQADKGAHAVR